MTSPISPAKKCSQGSTQAVWLQAMEHQDKDHKQCETCFVLFCFVLLVPVHGLKKFERTGTLRHAQPSPAPAPKCYSARQ